jgi:hypothetical protein
MALFKVFTTLRESQCAHKNISDSNMNAASATTSASSQNHHQAYWSDNTSRPRSGAIAIKTPTNCYHTDDLTSTERSNQRMYNRATWCMYNRILDHRRQNQCFAIPTRCLKCSDAEQEASRYIDSAEAQNLGTTIPPDCSLDGAVFELDI